LDFQMLASFQAHKHERSKMARRKPKPTAEEPVSVALPTTAEDAAAAAGQAGALQGLPADPEADSQSVRELVEEGNFFEAAVVEGVERAARETESPVHTSEEQEDDVPREYIDHDKDEPRE
jgi:hypothetical protein